MESTMNTMNTLNTLNTLETVKPLQDLRQYSPSHNPFEDQQLKEQICNAENALMVFECYKKGVVNDTIHRIAHELFTGWMESVADSDDWDDHTNSFDHTVNKYLCCYLNSVPYANLPVEAKEIEYELDEDKPTEAELDFCNKTELEFVIKTLEDFVAGNTDEDCYESYLDKEPTYNSGNSFVSKEYLSKGKCPFTGEDEDELMGSDPNECLEVSDSAIAFLLEDFINGEDFQQCDRLYAKMLADNTDSTEEASALELDTYKALMLIANGKTYHELSGDDINHIAGIILDLRTLMYL